MTQSEALKLVAILKAAYPRQPTDAATSEVYAGFLADLDYEAANEAIRRIITTSRFFPTIAEIREEVAENAVGLPSTTEALALVLERHRLSDEEHAANPLPPAVQKAYRIVGGGWAFRTSENPVALRAQFRDAYESIRREEIRGVQRTPAALTPGTKLAAIEAPKGVPLPQLREVPTT